MTTEQLNASESNQARPGYGWVRGLPPLGSPTYHLMLAVVAVLVLGPLGGVSAAFMNFSIGFFVGGQVLAGILGSAVTLPYGPEGRHGANYIQTMAASVASMCGMAVLLQSRHWLGLGEIPAWQCVLYFTCIGMLGVGVGMLYTPLLVDRMQLAFPSGFAVANILRALTDRALLKLSVFKLGGGAAAGFITSLMSFKLPGVSTTGLSPSTFGAGMIVGARIALPGLLVAIVGHFAKPYLVEIGWLEPNAPFRKIGFIIALGMILGAAILDVAVILLQALKRLRMRGPTPAPAPDWKRVNMVQLVVWVGFWALATVVCGHALFGEPVRFLSLGVALVFVFVLINGISLGISDSNPISSAFVLTVFILAAAGVTSPTTALTCASILLIACAVGGDMQQDRSTGWRLGTNRVVQFRYQVGGILMGAVLAVVLARVFMDAYPVLKLDQLTQHVEGAERWQSAMTYKIVGAVRGITTHQPHVMAALKLGVLIGLVTELARKLIRSSHRYKEWVQWSARAKRVDFVLDAILLPSPYASSFGGFVELVTTLWWAAGSVAGSVFDAFTKWRCKDHSAGRELPPDMSTVSLVGGGLIAGDSLGSLAVGMSILLNRVLAG